MQMSEAAWMEYVQKMRKISDEAASKMQQFIRLNGVKDNKKLMDYAWALSTYYGEAIGALSCEMYDNTAEAQGITVPPAEPAPTPTYGEVAKAINGTLKFSEKMLDQTVGRLVKQTGQDTTLRNADRDGAEFAWIPRGDTCAYCIALAAGGWRHMSSKTMKNGHATHIHAKCDCNYSVRFDGKSSVEGYDPKEYEDIYDAADPDGKPGDKIRALRRVINSQKKDENRKTENGQILNPNITNMEDEYIPKSVGAKTQNYDIMDLATGDKYHMAEGTKLQDKEVFAGKGSKKEYRNAYKYADRYGGNVEDWQHVKGKAVIDTPDGDIPAEVHWSQCENIGKFDFFVKRWLDDES